MPESHFVEIVWFLAGEAVKLSGTFVIKYLHPGHWDVGLIYA